MKSSKMESSKIERSKIENIVSDILIQDLLKFLNISRLNPIQIESIQKGLFFNQNFLVCTPSGSGKTLIGTMAIANSLFKNLGRAIYLVPLKSLANEKVAQFQKIFEQFDKKVTAATGDTKEQEEDYSDTDFLITTYEKCDALLRMKNPFFNDVRVIVIDEIHEMGSVGRGARLEILLMRLLSKLSFLQIIGLSATIANYNEFSNWLSSFQIDFEIIHTKKRPVKLNYHMQITPNKIKALREIIKKNLDPELESKGQLIVFVNRRKDCIKLSSQLQKYVSKFLSESEKKKCKSAKKFLENNRSTVKPLLEVLPDGIAYHNASLGKSERNIVEDFFRKGTIKVLIATTTLSAGVNMPARSVVIYDIVQHRKHINLTEEDYNDPNYFMFGKQGVIKPHSPNLLFQMAGRAGRFGYDDIGESYIFLRNKEELNFARFFYFQLEIDEKENSLIPKYAPLESSLNNRDVLLEIVLLFIYENKIIEIEDLRKFLESTYFGFCFKKVKEKEKEKEKEKKNILQYLFIEKMTPNYLLKVHGSKFNLNMKYKLEDISRSSIKATVYQSTARLHCSIDIKTGITCSCKTNKQCDNKFGNNNSYDYKLCPHISFLINSVYNNKPENRRIKKILDSLLPILLKHEYIMEFLIKNRLIGILPEINYGSKKYTTTSFGRLAINLYVQPSEIVWIRSALENSGFSEIKHLVEKVSMLYLFHSYKDLQVISEIILLWIDEHTVRDILSKFPKFGVGDLFSLKIEIERYCSIFASVCSYIGKIRLTKRFDLLSMRINHGVKEELVELLKNLPNLSRNKARILFNHGFKSSADIFVVEPMEIHNRTKIPLKYVMKLLGREKNKKSITLLNYF